MALSGRLKGSDAPGYVISQILGAIVASAVLLFLLEGLPDYEFTIDGLGANGNPHDMSMAALFFWELILTALFLYTIFTATRGDFTPGFSALAIGGFLFIAHLVGAQLGDSSLNPARSIGLALFVGSKALGVLWVYIIAPMIGGILGWILYRRLHDEPVPK